MLCEWDLRKAKINGIGIKKRLSKVNVNVIEDIYGRDYSRERRFWENCISADFTISVGVNKNLALSVLINFVYYQKIYRVRYHGT